MCSAALRSGAALTGSSSNLSERPDQMADEKSEKKPEVTIDAEREKEVLLGRLQAENKSLREELEAMKALESERAAAVAKAKAEKSAKAAQVPVALMTVLGEGRRSVKKGEQLRLSECVGLTAGEHYELVTLG